MNTRLITSFLCVLATLLYLLSITSAYATCDHPITIAHSKNYIPYQYISDGENPTGLDIDIVKAVLTEMGCGYELQELPSKRAQKLLKGGILDIMPAASITQKRSTYAYFSDPYRDEAVVMFVRSVDYQFYQDYDMGKAIDQKLKLSAGLGGWYGPEYGEEKQRALDLGLLTLNANTGIRIKQLLNGRVDVVIADMFVGFHHAIKLNKVDDLRPLPHLLNSDPVHFMLSKKSVTTEFVGDFNKALQKVLNSIEYALLLERYRPPLSVPTN